MNCPVCGEKIPFDSAECKSCGNKIDKFFLTEEVSESRVHKRAMEIPKYSDHKPSLRRQVRFTDRWKNVGMVVAAAAALVALAVFAAMSLFGGEGKPDTPEGAITGYYEALSQCDFGKMESYFARAFLPPSDERVAIEKALGETKCNVTGPALRTVSEDKGSAMVEIESLQVRYTKPGGVAEEHTLSTDVLQPLHLRDPGLKILVRVMNDGSGWLISGRPMGGWSVENLWLIGQPGVP